MHDIFENHIKPGWFLKLRNGSLINSQSVVKVVGSDNSIHYQIGGTGLAWRIDGRFGTHPQADNPLDVSGLIPPRSVVAVTLRSFEEIEKSLHQAVAWIERDELTHGRSFACGDAAREALKLISDIYATKWTEE